MSKKTIILKREVEEEKILPIAIEEGYKSTHKKEIVEKITMKKAYDKWYTIKEVLDEYNENKEQLCLVVIEVKDEPNPEIPIEYLARINQKRIDNRFTEILVNIHKREIDKKRQEEDKELEEQMKKAVWETEVDIV